MSCNYDHCDYSLWLCLIMSSNNCLTTFVKWVCWNEWLHNRGLRLLFMEEPDEKLLIYQNRYYGGLRCFRMKQYLSWLELIKNRVENHYNWWNNLYWLVFPTSILHSYTIWNKIVFLKTSCKILCPISSCQRIIHWN